MPIHLSKIPLPSSVPNEDFFIKYVLPYTWEGHLLVDNGWGPKNEIQELISDDPILGFKTPFLVSPTNVIEEFTGKSLDHKYHIAFPGEQWKLLVNFINRVKTFGVKEQNYVLNSYFTSKIPEIGEEIYQLHIFVSQDSTTLSLEKGKWIPSFDDTLLIARW